jgi:hypothetical protein
MKVKLSKRQWLRIGYRAGWVTAKRFNRVCAWCGDIMGEVQDNTEPLDEWVPDSHGLCPSCHQQWVADFKKKRGLTDAQIEALQNP